MMIPAIGNDRLLSPFGFTVKSGEMAVRTALANLISGLAPLRLDIEEVGTVELVLAEALNNIVEHAYPPDEQAGSIRLACRHQRDGLHLTISDHGKTMPDGQAPLGAAQSVEVDVMDLPEGGFGWFLIRDLAKDVQYQRTGNENRLDLRLAVAIPRPN